MGGTDHGMNEPVHLQYMYMYIRGSNADRRQLNPLRVPKNENTQTMNSSYNDEQETTERPRVHAVSPMSWRSFVEINCATGWFLSL